MKVLSIWHGAVIAEYQKRYQEMSRLGMEVTLVVPKQWRLVMVRPTKSERLPAADFNIIELPINCAWHGATFAYSGLEAMLEEHRPQLIECIEEPYSRAAHRVAKWRRLHAPQTRLIVSTCQNIHKRYPWPFSAWERFVLDEADGLTGLNAESLDVFQRKGFAGPAIVVPTGIDPEVFKPGAASREQESSSVDTAQVAIGFVGRLVEEKGLDVLIKAMAKVPERFKLVVAGDGPCKEQLLELASRLGISYRISWLDSVTHSQMPDFYRSMRIIVLPSVTRANWKEQFGRVLVEAMACGTNVIGSSSGEIPQVIGDAGLVYQEGDETGLAEKILRLAEDQQLAKSMQERGLQRVQQHYTWRRVAETLRDFFAEVMKLPAGDK